AEAPRALVEGHAMATDAPLHARCPMIAEILPDTRQIVVDLNAEPLEALRLADPRKLQQLWRGDGPGRDDHFTGRPCLALHPTHSIAHAHTAVAIEDEALGHRACLDGQVWPQARWVEIASRRAHAPAATDRALRHGDAFLIRAVVIRIGLD